MKTNGFQSEFECCLVIVFGGREKQNRLAIFPSSLD